MQGISEPGQPMAMKDGHKKAGMIAGKRGILRKRVSIWSAIAATR